MKSFAIITACGFALVSALQAQPAHPDADSPEAKEAMAMVANYHLARPSTSLAYQSVVVQQMLAEANYFSDRLKLPTKHPITVSEVAYFYVSPPWYGILTETNSVFWPATIFSNHIFDSSIPREQRAQALRIAVSGTIETTNFFCSFDSGRLWKIERLSEHGVEYYAKDIDTLIGKPSLITVQQAHELATQWLAAVDVDVPALEKKYPPEVNNLRVLPKNSTNIVDAPFFFVHWGWQYFTNGDDNHTVSSQPLVEVKILGTTKELVELHMLDASFSRRPLLLITNAIELINSPDPQLKDLKRPQISQTNSSSP